MNSLIHADIFFFIVSIGFSIVFVLLIIGIVYIVGILKSIRTITRKIEGDVESINAEAKELFRDIQSSVVYRMIFGKPRRLK